MNVKLLRQIQKAIREEPRRVDMGNWINTEAPKHRPGSPPCGTTACIAGFAVVLSHGDKDKPFKEQARDVEDKSYAGVLESFQSEARKVLKLTGRQADRLFFTSSWPIKFFALYRDARWQFNSKNAAAAVISRINHFIKTKGRE